MSSPHPSTFYTGPDDVPSRIPVFPLHGAILLPRGTLPLNVFEPRFLTMVDDVLSQGRVIGIIQPQPDGAPEDLSVSLPEGAPPQAPESPPGKSAPLRRVGCAGRLTAFSEGVDRHVVITLTGISRFTITEELETALPYRVCDVGYQPYAEDFVPGLGEAEVDRDKLLAALKTYLQVHGLSADWESIHAASTEHLVNSLSMISPYGAEEKQALLESASLQERADILIALAEMEIAQKGHSDSGTTLQ